ncbi:MAG: hypothetical protein KDD64_13985, partial [Bdellovibrionales bacterium]|nr:hypothetical protein [Bdellovibrionales bacterium]
GAASRSGGPNVSGSAWYATIRQEHAEVIAEHCNGLCFSHFKRLGLLAGLEIPHVMGVLENIPQLRVIPRDQLPHYKE